MERIQAVQDYVNQVLKGLPEEADKISGAAHLYGVSQWAALLAMRRAENVELAAVSGLLHDLYTYQTADPTDHAHKGAPLAGEILRALGRFSPEEIETVTHAIYCHSAKGTVDGPFDEVLKDADVLSHCLHNPLASAAPKERERYDRLRKELDLTALERL